MTHKSRLDKLEKAAAAYIKSLARPQLSAVCRLYVITPPAGVSTDVWGRVVQLLADYRPALLYPWKSLDQVADWCEGKQIDEVNDLPDPMLDAVGRALVEAETGELPEDWVTRDMNRLSRLAETSDEELMAFLRWLEEPDQDYSLPQPYSRFLLQQIADEDILSRCRTLADRLQRGEITAAEHAAELVTFLPTVTRADLEKAVWKSGEMSLAGKDRAERSAQARDALADVATQRRTRVD